MNKKFIISKTITFLGVVAFVIIFKMIFGDENTLVGVTTITATLMFLQRDLSLSPIKNTVKFILLNLLIGFASYVVSKYLYLGIFVGFFTLFIISYNYCYNLSNPLYLPFILQYLFLLANPVDGSAFVTRIISLIAGAIIIMLPQIIFNKNRFGKSGNKLLESVCDVIIAKLEYNDQHDLIEGNLDSVTQSIDSFRAMVYDKREYNYYLTNEARVKLNLSVALENIHSMIHSADLSKIDKDILDTLIYLLKSAKLLLNSSEDINEESDISIYILSLLRACEEKDINDLLNLQLLDSMLLLSDTLKYLCILDEEKFNIVDKSQEISELFSNSTFKSFLDRKSLRFCYAARIAITITIGTFIVDYFKLQEGRWILFTLQSLITPIYEVSHSKTKDRVFATIVGSIIIFILFNIFKSPTSRMLIVLASGYLNGLIDRYRYTIIFVTMSAVGSAALNGNINVMTGDRLLYVFIGALMAIFANKFIFPYNLEDSLRELKTMYHNTIVSMLREIQNLIENKSHANTMKNLVVIASLIDAKARSNQTLVNSTSYKEVIKERRSLVANIYELYILILKKKIRHENQKEIIKDLADLMESPTEDIGKKIEHMEHSITETKNISTKITLSSIIVILKELCHLSTIDTPS